ncbi:MAG: GIY-YIG nuclease family protein [Vicinamibacteria bacterium]|nr:GIY-YIG nuclease family protein [Vicinamibacteria bacterium]
MAFVYLLRCADGSLYAGVARDLAARVAQHQAGRGAKYTRARLPVALVWSQPVRTFPRALSFEARIKRLTRARKLALAAGTPLAELIDTRVRRRRPRKARAK